MVRDPASEEELNISLTETDKTCSTSLNASPSTEQNTQFVNFEDIDNFDIFQDHEPKVKTFSLSQTSDHNQKIDKNEYYTFDSPLSIHSKKISLERFENSLLETNFVESSENFPGNYNKYLEKVIRTLENFHKIDFFPLIERRSIFLPKTEKKYTLVIDLDETLIHSDFDNELKENYQKILQFTHEGETIMFSLFVRPGLQDFLNYIKERFEVVIFTASRKEYADCILNYLDPENNIISHRLYREDCISIKNKIFIKDLRIFRNRTLNKLILIDNSFYSFSNQPSNGILITSYYDNPRDKELYNLKKYLQNLYESNPGDVRDFNEKVFNFEGIIQHILEN